MLQIILLLLTLSNLAFADVKVSFDHDAEFYRARVVQTTELNEKNDLHDFFESLILDEEYRETEVVKYFQSKDGNFFFICERNSHAQNEIVASCSFRQKKGATANVSILSSQGFEIWSFNSLMAKELSPLFPETDKPVVLNIHRKFSVVSFANLATLKFN